MKSVTSRKKSVNSSRAAERLLSALPGAALLPAKDGPAVLSHEPGVQRNKLEVDNSELLHTLQETEIVLQKQKDLNRHLSREISRYSESEKKLVDSHARQHNLSARLITAREEERAACAREIQEELGQLLAALQLSVSMLAVDYRDHKSLVARIESMNNILALSISTVQRISSELRPVMLDLLGLADAIEWQAKEFRKKSGISCETVIRIAGKKVAPGVTTAVFRIFQEALSNVALHSGATCVRMYLVEKKGWLILSLRDDGRGITEKEKQDLQSLGIAGMRERAKVYGGKLRICGSSSHGTALFARIPLAGREDRHAHQDTYSR